MFDLTFKNWLLREGRDIFGFDKEIEVTRKRPESDGPINSINVECISNALGKMPIGARQPKVNFVNQIQWGEGNGALRVYIHPDLHLEFAKLGVDLEGNPKWITKKLYLINRDGYGSFEEPVVHEIAEVLNQLNDQPPDSAKTDFDDMEGLVADMASKLRIAARNVFYFNGVRKVNNENYIIRFSVRGAGVGRLSGGRVEENQTQIHYNKKAGYIRVTNYCVESPMNTHKWELMPVDTDLYFFPTQTFDEITETISNYLQYY